MPLKVKDRPDRASEPEPTEMPPSPTVENYLKAIYGAQAAAGAGRLVPLGQLAATLGVVPGTATAMVKTLADSQLVHYEPYLGCRLTAAGEKLAARVLRRHRLIELFLVKELGMSWAEVHDEAEQLEHAVSDRLIDRIDEILGRPAVDPHGDPIPGPEGTVTQPEYQSLLTCPLGIPVTVGRITDQDADFLRFVEDHDLKPGQMVEVEARDSLSDSVCVKGQGSRRITMGARAASKLLVQIATMAAAVRIGVAALGLVAGVLAGSPATAWAGQQSEATGGPATTGAPVACSVHGMVRDESGLPVGGAVVTPASGGAPVLTDREGRFCLTAVPTGRVRLTVSGAGFSPRSVDIDVAAGGASAPIDVTLQASGLQDEVVVTATRTKRRLEDVPVRTEVVDATLMRAIAARTLAEAVEYTTGVRVESNCQNCNFSQIRLLGLEGPYTQILIDSQPVISSLAQVYGIEQIPARMIERIEIVKGGGSALYGSGAVGGVVNVISREPARSGGMVETRADLVDGRPHRSHTGSFDWAARDLGAAATTFFQVDEVQPLDVTGDGYTEVSRRRLLAGGVRASHALLEGRAKLLGEVTAFGEDRRGGNALDLPPEQADIAEWIASRRIGASATWVHGVSRRLDYRLTLALAAMQRDSYYGTGRDPHAFGITDNRLTLADAQVNHYAGRHVLSWGGQFSVEDLTDRQPAYGRLTDATYRNAGLFMQDDWSFASGWAVVYGARADWHSAVGRPIVSPRVALMVSPSEALDFRASMARGFRAPQAFDEDLHLGSVGGQVRFIRLDPALREESSTNYMLGAEWKPEAGRGQALLEVNGFLTTLDDLFLARDADDPDTSAVEFVKVNHGRARVYGVELNSGWGVGDAFVIQGGVVLQRARFVQPEPAFGSRDFFRTPARYGNLTVTWRRSPLGSLFAGLRYTGPMTAPHYAGFIGSDRLEVTSAFLTFDASVAYPIAGAGARRLTLTVAGRNLTNAFQRDLDQGPLRDAGYVYGPRFPRAISVGLGAEF
jgi:outer membrane receptor for ferrienterochelin and colicins